VRLVVLMQVHDAILNERELLVLDLYLAPIRLSFVF
jgi:hypothetical protein